MIDSVKEIYVIIDDETEQELGYVSRKEEAEQLCEAFSYDCYYVRLYPFNGTKCQNIRYRHSFYLDRYGCVCPYPYIEKIKLGKYDTEPKDYCSDGRIYVYTKELDREEAKNTLYRMLGDNNG